MTTRKTYNDSAVKAAQEKLVDLGLLREDAATGELDTPTRTALVALQQHGGVPTSGELDNATTALLDNWNCGTPLDSTLEDDGHTGFIARFTQTGSPYNKTELTYQFDPLPAGWDAQDIVGGINQALQAWSAVTPLRFTQRMSGADIRFRFDGLLTKPDGTMESMPSWATGTARYGQITFNPTNSYSSAPPAASSVVNVVMVAMHEIGHVLGLGHSANTEAIMYFSTGRNLVLSADDIEGLQAFYGAASILVPGWFGASTSGADVALANFQQLPSPFRLDLLVGQIDNPAGADTAYYRVGWDVDQNGFPRSGWSPIVPLGGPLGHDSQGMGLAVGHIGGGSLDLVLVWMDNPSGENNARYRIAFNLDSSGMNGTWTGDFQIPGPWGNETAGLAAAIYDVNENDTPDLIVAWVDAPDGENKIYYKIGFDIDTNGNVGQWSPRMEVSGWVGSSTGGLGIAVGDVRGNGRPDLVVFWVDDPDGDNRGYVRVGRDLDSTGFPLSGWDKERPVPGWWGVSTTGAGAALADLRHLLRPDLVVLNLDAPGGAIEEDRAHYRILSPPLPTWNVVSQVAGGNIPSQRIAAIKPSANVIAAASRSAPAAPGAPAPVTVAVWDQTDLNENQGSDILEFVTQSTPAARPDSPVAVAARTPAVANVFWIDTDDLVRTGWSTNLGQVGTPATGPIWFLPGIQLPGAQLARSIPPSPIAAASIHDLHVGVFIVGREDEILTQCWDGNVPVWLAASSIPWTRPESARPVSALAAERLNNQVFLFWVDNSGAIWECTVNDQNAAGAPRQIHSSNQVDTRSNLVAVSRKTNEMDLFWIDPSGHVTSASRTPAGGWETPSNIGGGRTAVLPGSVAAVHAGEERLQAFWEESDRSIWSSWRAFRADGVTVPWSRPVQVVPVGSAQGGQDMVAVSRDPEHVRLFFIDSTGVLASIYWGSTP